MLDAISDFWKPSRKNDEASSLDTQTIKPGAVIGFGFIPQPELSGRRVEVRSINTYMFEGDRMTSFVLDAQSNSAISLIIADSDQEKYIAISRRIPFAERTKLFDNSALLACMDGDEKTRLTLKTSTEWANWTVSEYKKAIGGLNGQMATGDYRGLAALPDHVSTKAFTYTLLVSNNNEFALEIEQYSDNKMEVYATVYRRLTDIGEIDVSAVQGKSEPSTKETPPAPTVAKTARQLAALKPANDSAGRQDAKQDKVPALESADMPLVAETSPSPLVEETPAAAKVNEARAVAKRKMEMLKMEFSTDEVASGPRLFDVPDKEEDAPLASLPHDIEPVKEAVPDLGPLIADEPAPEPEPETPQEPTVVDVAAPDSEPESESEPDSVEEEPVIEETPIITADAITADVEEKAAEVVIEEAITETQAQQPTQEANNQEQKEQTMATFNANINGNNEPKADAFIARAIQPEPLAMENDSVECELPAANRVIEEAIRNEMSMSDVIRRIIALPVARQESVSIPVMLTDADYSLLAVRYGIPAADRAAIKAKVMEEIGDFSGK